MSEQPDWKDDLCVALYVAFGTEPVSVRKILDVAKTHTDRQALGLRAALKAIPGVTRMTALQLAREFARTVPYVGARYQLRRTWEGHNKIWTYQVLNDAAPASSRPRKARKPKLEKLLELLPELPKPTAAPKAQPVAEPRTTVALDFDEREIARLSRGEAQRKIIEKVPTAAPAPTPAVSLVDASDYEQIFGGPYADEIAQARAVSYFKRSALGYAGVGEIASTGAVPVTHDGKLYVRTNGVRPDQARRVAAAIRSLNRDFTVRIGLYSRAPTAETLRTESAARAASGISPLRSAVKTRTDWPIF